MKLAIIILFLVISISQLLAQGSNQSKSLINDVSFLTHDSLEGREMGTRGELIAARYIHDRFEEIGLDPLIEDSSFYQIFTKNLSKNPHSSEASEKTISGRNVVGFLNNNASGTIIIGAHYDHLGWGEEGSLSTEKAIHNGADDNASGIAALLFLAENLSEEKLKHNIIFVAFTGEEKGLLGSNLFANQLIGDSNDVSFMINMDMVGRLDSLRRLAIYGIGTSPVFEKTIHKIHYPTFQFVLDSSGMGPSDHTSFYVNNIPVLHFFTGQHEQYHKPTDDVELINFDGLYDVSNFILQLVLKLDNKKDLPFLKTNDSQQNEKRRFKVTLGIIPDYLFDGVGLKIDGVKENRTAAVSGIVRGDIIVKMGDMKIDNIYDYMNALEYYEPSMTIFIEVIRNSERLTLELTFQ